MSSKVRTFSRVFPSYHPKAGKPTNFVERILNTLEVDYQSDDYFHWLVENNAGLDTDIITSFYTSLVPVEERKGHTIRGGKHFNFGDTIVFRVWSGRPYNSKQINFAPDAVVNTWPVAVDTKGDIWVKYNTTKISNDEQLILAENDGLTYKDFKDWFMINRKEDFYGQIICWDKEIEY